MKVLWNKSEVGIYVHDRDWLLAWRTQILDHILDEHGTLSDLALCGSVSDVQR